MSTNPPPRSNSAIWRHGGAVWPRNLPWWGIVYQNADTNVMIPPGRILTVNEGSHIGDRVRMRLGLRHYGALSSTRNAIAVSMNTVEIKTTATAYPPSFGFAVCQGWVTNLMVTKNCSVMDPLRLSTTWPGIAVAMTRSEALAAVGERFAIAAEDRTITDAPASPMRAFVGLR